MTSTAGTYDYVPSERYLAAAKRLETAQHAMQTGVAFVMEKDERSTQPKHLRVGINARAVETTAMMRLLVAKGIITEEEYMEAVALEMEEEVKRYEGEVRQLYKNPTIHLH